ncbi:Outer membrane protein TolC [Granulicella rosea]|uniref:Outer membrane protein TolC n=1 Tax=Granulicella rosea TaxID=474952 RepID=A0A239MLC7_9BACT|nr:TolC family protein [Granulicella rosea]SNT42599.1 Outer membrane protein TolC [Granulicella rosea]
MSANTHKVNVLAAAFLCGAAGLARGQQAALPAGPAPAKTATAGYGVGANAPSRFDSLFSRYAFNYRATTLEPMQFTDSMGDAERAALLVSDGAIRLSLKDAIALAVENNLDVESVRLLNPMARADLARARSGQLLRNLPSNTNPGASSASGTLATASPFGYEGTGAPGGTLLSGLNVQLAGSQIPNTEPVFFATGRIVADQLPLANLTVTGTNFLDSHIQDYQAGLRKGYLTGTTLTAAFEDIRTSRNAPYDSINPSLAANAFFRVDQHLLQGFGWKTNTRAIHIAKNNARLADSVFEQQLILTVAEVQGLYYDLISFVAQRRVLAEAVDRDQHVLEQTKGRLDLGLAAESDVIQAQIRVDGNHQALTDADAQIAEQEATLKSVLTHAGLEDPRIVNARLELTDDFSAVDPALLTADVNTLGDRAVAARVEMKEADLALENARLSLQGTRNAVRPVFDVYALVQGNGLAGRLNPLAPANIQTATDRKFVGNFGSALSQIAQGAFPDYEVGFQLNVPLVNRAAQSDLARDQVELRQREIARQSLRNGVRLQTIKSALALRQAKAQYDLSVGARKLMEHNLATERKMFDFGTSDPTRLYAVQSALDRSRIQEITARNTLARAQINLQAVLNQTLEVNGVAVDASRTGH